MSSRYIPLRSMEIDGARRSVAIRLVETDEKMQAACDLINDRYAWRGYGANHRLPTDASHITFTAEIDQEVVGTITLAVDSPRGLAVDKAFKKEIDYFRALSEARVCELTKFAFSSTIRSKELMAALFHIVFVYGHRTFECTDLFIEVNPRHVRFYETMLGFQRIGSVHVNEMVSAPAQLMKLKVAMIREQIERCASGRHRSGTRSLYPFFFSPTEEQGIYRRLMQTERHITKHPMKREAAADYPSAAAPAISIPSGETDARPTPPHGRAHQAEAAEHHGPGGHFGNGGGSEGGRTRIGAAERRGGPRHPNGVEDTIQNGNIAHREKLPAPVGRYVKRLIVDPQAGNCELVHRPGKARRDRAAAKPILGYREQEAIVETGCGGIAIPEVRGDGRARGRSAGDVEIGDVANMEYRGARGGDGDCDGGDRGAQSQCPQNHDATPSDYATNNCSARA